VSSPAFRADLSFSTAYLQIKTA